MACAMCRTEKDFSGCPVCYRCAICCECTYCTKCGINLLTITECEACYTCTECCSCGDEKIEVKENKMKTCGICGKGLPDDHMGSTTLAGVTVLAHFECYKGGDPPDGYSCSELELAHKEITRLVIAGSYAIQILFELDMILNPDKFLHHKKLHSNIQAAHDIWYQLNEHAPKDKDKL